MPGKHSARKAPRIRILLVTGAFLLFMPAAFTQFTFDENCRKAYASVLSLRFAEAGILISAEKKQSPENLVPVYLQNMMDFLTLAIGEERADYNRLKNTRNERLSALENGRHEDPFYRYSIGEFHLQWAIARMKFGDYTAGAFEIRKAWSALSENDKLYPSFRVNKLALGVLHVMVSLVPDKYKWVSNLIGLEGSAEQGMNEIRQVAEYSGPDEITLLFKPQAAFYLAFLELNFRGNKRDALQVLPMLENQQIGNTGFKSPLLIYARASILMKNGLNEKALVVLQERRTLDQTYPFYYLDYLEGIARLNHLDTTAAGYFRLYSAKFRGTSYIRSARQKLAWIALLKGDTVNYHRMMQQSSAPRSNTVDEDRQVTHEAGKGNVPNVILLKSRLLFDGGYYDRALAELLNKPVKSVVRSKGDLVEYKYRLARIYHESGNRVKAEDYYRQAVALGRSEPFYFAAGAALQLGLLYENAGEYDQANSAFRLCLSIDTPEYKTSLHQKAKAGLKRLKNKLSKT